MNESNKEMIILIIFTLIMHVVLTFELFTYIDIFGVLQ